MKYQKYTKEQLNKFAKESKYMYDMIRNMGLTASGSAYKHYKRKLIEHNIDTSHWMTPKEIYKHKLRHNTKNYLVKHNTKIGTKVLRKAIIDRGIEYKCSVCQLDSWQNKPLVLQIDHINGDNTDNVLQNLRFLCPNCHTQTENYGSKKLKTHVTPKKCLNCENVVPTKYSKRCVDCNRLNLRKIQRPTKEELSSLVWSIPSIEIAKQYNMSDKNVNKWCKAYGITKPPRGYWAKKKAGLV